VDVESREKGKKFGQTKDNLERKIKFVVKSALKSQPKNTGKNY